MCAHPEFIAANKLLDACEFAEKKCGGAVAAARVRDSEGRESETEQRAVRVPVYYFVLRAFAIYFVQSIYHFQIELSSSVISCFAQYTIFVEPEQPFNWGREMKLTA